MTDNEIMKTIEVCVEHDACFGCPHSGNVGDFGCDKLTMDMVFKFAVRQNDVINRQKDEIEGLIIAQETLQRYVAKLNKELERANAKNEAVRSEAIEEFAQSVKDLAYKKSHSDKEIHSWYEDINNLVKEMAGADNAD